MGIGTGPKQGEEEMPQIEVHQNHEEASKLLSNLKTAWSSVYLTLISLIQGVALAYLFERFAEKMQPSIESVDASTWLKFGSAVMILVIVWQEYLSGSIAFVSVPTLRDAFIPFLLGVVEFFVSHFVGTAGPYWYISVCALWLLGSVAYWNFYCQAGQYRENDYILKSTLKPKGVSYFKWVNSVLSLSYAGIFFALSKFHSQRVSEIIALLLLVIFIIKCRVYWRIILILAQRGLATSKPLRN
jgi:hypothetical protein